MTMHYCYTSDGAKVMCLCVRGVDHDEDEFDVPIGDDGAMTEAREGDKK